MNIKANPNATNSEMDSKTIINHSNIIDRTTRDTVIEQFVELVVDGMDTKDLIRYVMDDLTEHYDCLLYTSPSPRDVEESRMPSSA